MRSHNAAVYVVHLLVPFPSDHGEVGGLPVVFPSVTTLQGACEYVAGVKIGLSHIARQEDTEVRFSGQPVWVVFELSRHKQRPVVFGAHGLASSLVALVCTANLKGNA